jgi:hypothetical protein
VQVIVFCTTARVTGLVAGLLGELNLNIREIHSRKAQTYRTRVSNEFRKSRGLILVTSDVSARGVDYPDVTLVLQVYLCHVTYWTSVFVLEPKEKGWPFAPFQYCLYYQYPFDLLQTGNFLCIWHKSKSLSELTFTYCPFELL